MSHDFTKALIRAAKRNMSGQSVDLVEVVGKIADLAPEHVCDADISHHLTTALFDLAQLTDAQRSILYDVVRMHQTPEQRRRILAVLAFTPAASTPGTREAFLKSQYVRWLSINRDQAARGKPGYKPGWPLVRFKARFGFWPDAVLQKQVKAQLGIR